jgi:predicted deacetylase
VSAAAAAPPLRVHVAVHDVALAHRARLERIDALLARLGVGARYSMLLVPDYHRQGRLDADPAFVSWLRGRAAAGVEMLLHGYSHLDESRHEGLAARWKAGQMTAGEGEFLGIGGDEALRRLVGGRSIVEAAAGAPVAGFVAPAWLYGAQARQALARAGLRLAEDHWAVWSPADGRRLLRSPVVSWASRTPWRLRTSVWWSRAATTLLRPLAVVRVGIHPFDVDHPRLEREIERTLSALLRNRRPMLLADLLEPPPAR